MKKYRIINCAICGIEIKTVRWNKKYCNTCSNDDEIMRARRKVWQGNWQRNNPEKIKEQTKKYYKNNLEKAKAANKKWRANNHEKIKEYNRKYLEKKRLKNET